MAFGVLELPKLDDILAKAKNRTAGHVFLWALAFMDALENMCPQKGT